MESLGAKLKEARLYKNLDIKDIVEETNISPVFLKALENEDFDKFPSEIYLLGFLRSYSEFLNLNPEKMIQTYKGYKLAESETPLEELTKPTTNKLIIFLIKYKFFFFLLLLIFILFLGGWFFKNYFLLNVDLTKGETLQQIKADLKGQPENEISAGTKALPFDYKKEIKEVKNLDFRNNKGFILASSQEIVLFRVENREVSFLITKISSEEIGLKFLPAEEEFSLRLEEEKKIIIPSSPKEIIISLKGLTENKAKIKVLLGKKNSAFHESSLDADLKPEMETRNIEDLKIIFEVFFEDKSFIELYLDGVQKARGFFAKGEQLRWKASEVIQIKIGNAGGVKANINNQPYIFGKSGEVVNKVITWQKDKKNPNLYKIIVKDW